MTEYHVVSELAGYIAGMAMGVRQLIRRLARGDVVFRMLVHKRASQPAAAAASENIDHARQWAREMVRAARKRSAR